MQSLGIFGGSWQAIQALPAWQGAAVVVVTAIALAVALRVGGDRFVRRVTDRIPGEVDDVVFGAVHRGLYVTVAVAGVFAGLMLFDLRPADATRVHATALSLVTITWMILLMRMGRQVSDEATEDGHLDQKVVPVIQNVWTAVVGVGGLFLLLVYWNVDVTPLLASAGVAGIVVGLAARDTIANLFGSIALYLDGTYRVGDYVVLETGERGRVEDISVRSTVIRTRDDVLVTVPNAALNNAAIVNESTPKRKRRIRVPVGVAYGTDLDEVEAILLAVAADDDTVLERPEPRVRFREFGSDGLNLELLCWVPNPAMRARVKHYLIKDIYERFQTADVKIPFPQRDVTVSVADDPGVLTGDGTAAAGPADPADGIGEARQND